MQIAKTIVVNCPGLGDRIRIARKASEKSLEALAGAAGVSRGYWHDLEAERIRSALPEATLRRIEGVLGVDFGVEFGEVECSLTPL